jgi:hypothetical protein
MKARNSARLMEGGVVNHAAWRFALGMIVAALLGAAFPTASRAVPLDSILPPDAGSEGTPAGPTSIRPGATPAPSSGRTEATAPPLEDITGQTMGPNAENVATGAPTPGVIVDGIPSLGPPVPPGFAWPAVLSTRNWFHVQDWYVETDAQVLDHTPPLRHNPLLADTSSGRVFDRENLDLGLAAGAHITLGTYLGEDYQKHDHSLEFTFQGLDDWNGHFNLIAATPSTTDTSTTTGNFGSLVNLLNFPNADFFNGADFYHIDYHSDINSAEVNVRVKTHYLEDQLVYDPDDGRWNQHINSAATFSYLFGFRYLNLSERLNVSAGLNSMAGTIEGFPAGNFGGEVDARVENNLIGFQPGVELDYQYERWSVGVSAKSAICLNFAQDRLGATFNDPALTPENFSAAKVRSGAISEINLIAGYQISPKARLRVTYDFEFLTSVGLAPNELNLAGPNGPGALIVSNGLFLNGLSAGLDYIW